MKTTRRGLLRGALAAAFLSAGSFYPLTRVLRVPQKAAKPEVMLLMTELSAPTLPPTKPRWVPVAVSEGGALRVMGWEEVPAGPAMLEQYRPAASSAA